MFNKSQFSHKQSCDQRASDHSENEHLKQVIKSLSQKLHEAVEILEHGHAPHEDRTFLLPHLPVPLGANIVAGTSSQTGSLLPHTAPKLPPDDVVMLQDTGHEETRIDWITIEGSDFAFDDDLINGMDNYPAIGGIDNARNANVGNATNPILTMPPAAGVDTTLQRRLTNALTYEHLRSLQDLPISSPSLFCRDILHLEGVIKHIMFTQGTGTGQPSLDTLIRTMLETLISKGYWYWTKPFLTESLAWKHVGRITRYRIEPTRENYYRLPPQYRPTQLRLTHFSWPIIDWIAWPQLRDKLILHSGEYDLTLFVQATMQHYCLEMEILEAQEYAGVDEAPQPDRRGDQLSATGFVRTRVYYRLHEYLEYLELLSSNTSPKTGDDASPRGAMSASLEAKIVSALQEDVTPFKLSPELFHQFPMLYDEHVVVAGTYRSIFSTYIEAT